MYELSLGDVVETDGAFQVTRLKRPSSHSTFRVWFGDSRLGSIRQKVEGEMSHSGALTEWSSHNLLALSVPTASDAAEIARRLARYQANEELVFEEATRRR